MPFYASHGGPTIRYVEILRRDPCVWCLRPRKDITLDHIEPKLRRSHKGSGSRILLTGYSIDHWTNLSAACRQCNRERGSRSLLQFLGEKLDRSYKE